MALEDVLHKVNEKASTIPGIGKTLRINLGDGIVFIDGTGEYNVVNSDDKDADCTVSLTEETLHALATGTLNPMMAVMGGKVKIKGDISVAMKLQSLLG